MPKGTRRVLRILGRALYGLCVRIPFYVVCYSVFGIAVGVTALACWAFYEAGTSERSKDVAGVVKELLEEPLLFFFRSGLGLLLFLMTAPCLAWWIVKALARAGGFVPKEECDLDVFLPKKLSALRSVATRCGRTRRFTSS